MLGFKKGVFSTAYICSISRNVIVVDELVRMYKKWLWPVLRCCTNNALTDCAKLQKFPGRTVDIWPRIHTLGFLSKNMVGNEIRNLMN